MNCYVNHLAWVENVKVICPRSSTRLEVCRERIINIIRSPYGLLTLFSLGPRQLKKPNLVPS